MLLGTLYIVNHVFRVWTCEHFRLDGGEEDARYSCQQLIVDH